MSVAKGPFLFCNLIASVPDGVVFEYIEDWPPEEIEDDSECDYVPVVPSQLVIHVKVGSGAQPPKHLSPVLSCPNETL